MEPTAKFAFAGVLLWAGFQLLGVLISILLAFAVSAVFSLYAMYRLAFRRSESPLLWNRQEARLLLVYCLPLAISNLFGVAAPRSDFLILGYWATTKEVGIYLAAVQTAASFAYLRCVHHGLGADRQSCVEPAKLEENEGELSGSLASFHYSGTTDFLLFDPLRQ